MTAPSSNLSTHRRRHRGDSRGIRIHQRLVLGRYSPNRPSTQRHRLRRCVRLQSDLTGLQMVTVFTRTIILQYRLHYTSRLTKKLV